MFPCACLCVHLLVCVGYEKSHLPQQIFPGERRSQCTVIMNMIYACRELRWTWLMCFITSQCGDLFVCVCVCFLYYYYAQKASGETGHDSSWRNRCYLSLTLFNTPTFGMWLFLDTGCMLVFFVFFLRVLAVTSACFLVTWFLRKENRLGTQKH